MPITLAETTPNSNTYFQVIDSNGNVEKVVPFNNLPTSTAWELIDSWTHSVDVSSVTFTNITGYNDVMLLIVDITSDVTGNIAVSVSSDNGTTLEDFLMTGGPHNQFDVVTLSQTTYKGACSIFHNFGTELPKGITCSVRQSSDLLHAIGIDTLSVLNCISVKASTGNMTGGSIYILGKN